MEEADKDWMMYPRGRREFIPTKLPKLEWTLNNWCWICCRFC